MLEEGQVLKTWALPQDPLSADSQLADVLSDHRLAYLNYEGPISGDRGTVTRWDQGTYESLERDEARLVVLLRGQKLVGRVTIEPATEAPIQFRWSFAPVS
jgi:hypothetical protein